VNPNFVSVVIPTYNEGRRIQSTLERVIQYLSAKFSRFEIIVVDDGSADGTPQQVARAAHQEPRIKFIPLSANRGKGFVVREGVLSAQGEVIFFTDADLSTPVEEIEKGLAGLEEGYPVVIASRRHPESIVALHQVRRREIVGRAFNLFVRALLSLPFHDTQCGFKGFSREAAREIFSLARIDGFAFDAEILVIARRLGFRVREIPVYWTNSPDSKVRLMRHLSGVASDLLKIRCNDRQGLYSPHGIKS
jgi:dolichyl-phosphate beta-glucosyltransferase